MATAGFIAGLGKQIEERRQEHHAEDEASHLKERERKADELEGAIGNIQQRGALAPDAPGYLSPDQVKAQIEEAHKQLTGLYKPHEAPKLFERLSRKGKAPAAGTPGTTGTGGVQIKPNMTIDDVLAQSGPAPAKKDLGRLITAKPVRDADGSWVVYRENPNTGQITKEPVPGYSEETAIAEFEREYKAAGYSDADAKKAALHAYKISTGEEAKAPSAFKPLKYDKETDTITDSNRGVTYQRGQAGMPKEVEDMFGSQKRVQKHREDLQSERLKAIADRQAKQLDQYIEKTDYKSAKTIVDKAYGDLEGARVRTKRMDENYNDAIATGSQQAMLSLTANHIGMTLGAQKGTRITRAAWDEAVNSLPWWDEKMAKFFHEGPNGDMIFDGWKDGVNLSGDQMRQMVDLAHENVDILQTSYNDLHDHYRESLEVGPHAPGKGGGKKQRVNIQKAMALPENKGKTEQEVRDDITAEGYEPYP